MKSIETLARADVFCVDKTGTITDNEMTVSDCVAPEDSDPAAMTQTRMLISRYLKTVTDDNIRMVPGGGRFYGDPYPAVLFEEQVQRSGNA
jgi:cation-transporting ATPase E